MPDPAPPAPDVIIPGSATDNSDGPVVQIRPFEPRDAKEVRMLLGMGVMEQLALANTLLYTNPLVVAAWLLISAIMIGLMKWWPQPDGPFWTWLMPLPALASCAVPFLFAIDWLNRAYFEHLVRHVLSREDAIDFPAYYSAANSAGSAFFVLIYKKNPIGLIAVDTWRPLEELRGLEELKKEREERAAEGEGEREKEGEKGGAKKRKGKAEKKPTPTSTPAPSPGSGTGTVAYIRHFHLDSPYRPTFIQNDLFAHGLSSAFSLPSVQTAYFRVSRLTPWLQEVSTTMGMKRCARPEGGVDLDRGEGMGRGLQRWREWWVGVGREEWERRYEDMRELHGL